MKRFGYRGPLLLIALLLALTSCLIGCEKNPHPVDTADTGNTTDTEPGDDARVSIDFGLTKEGLTADEAVAAWLDSCDDVGRTIFDFYVLADGGTDGTYTYLVYYEVPAGAVRINARIRENDRGYVFPEIYYTTDASTPCAYDITRVTFRDCAREPQTLTIFLDGEQVDPLITWR